MNLSETILTVLFATIIIAICHIPIYYLLLNRYQDPTLILIIIFLIYVIVLTIFYTIFPFTKFSSSNRQPEEEN